MNCLDESEYYNEIVELSRTFSGLSSMCADLNLEVYLHTGAALKNYTVLSHSIYACPVIVRIKENSDRNISTLITQDIAPDNSDRSSDKIQKLEQCISTILNALISRSLISNDKLQKYRNQRFDISEHASLQREEEKRMKDQLKVISEGPEKKNSLMKATGVELIVDRETKNNLQTIEELERIIDNQEKRMSGKPGEYRLFKLANKINGKYVNLGLHSVEELERMCNEGNYIKIPGDFIEIKFPSYFPDQQSVINFDEHKSLRESAEENSVIKSDFKVSKSNPIEEKSTISPSIKISKNNREEEKTIMRPDIKVPISNTLEGKRHQPSGQTKSTLFTSAYSSLKEEEEFNPD